MADQDLKPGLGKQPNRVVIIVRHLKVVARGPLLIIDLFAERIMGSLVCRRPIPPEVKNTRIDNPALRSTDA